MNQEKIPTPTTKLKRWLKRLGFAGFLFFLIKGLIWIGIAAVAYYHSQK